MDEIKFTSHKQYLFARSFSIKAKKTGQASQVHQGSGIRILKISSSFYILLVSLRGANPENFSSDWLRFALFAQILRPFECFRVHLIFPVMTIFSILGSDFQKFSNLQSLARYSLKYIIRFLQETVQNIDFQEHEIFVWVSENLKLEVFKTWAKKSNFGF